MLFILAGDIRSGKTRWLCDVVKDMQSRGVDVYGVLAPGRWRPFDCDGDSNNAFAVCDDDDGNAIEKIGIDNVLLPGGKVVDVASRADLEKRDTEIGSSRGWEFSDDAMAQVDAHFKWISSGVFGGSIVDVAPTIAPGSLLVVDEFGPLEFWRGEGLQNALSLVDSGPSDVFPNAIVVVRDDFAPQAIMRFSAAWRGQTTVIAPNEQARQTLAKYIG